MKVIPGIRTRVEAELSSGKMADKQFQIVVFGASGFVGKLVAKHLAQDYVVRLTAMSMTSMRYAGAILSVSSAWP